MIIDKEKSQIRLKICLFGPAMSGKTTTLKSFFEILGKDPNRIRSIETTTGRTLFVDFGTISMFHGDWKIDFLCFTATGQDFYAVTRGFAASQVDGIIFVADGTVELQDDNVRSWTELKKMLKGKLNSTSILIALNKCDLPNQVSEKTLREKLQTNLPIIKTSALEKLNIDKCFDALLSSMFGPQDARQKPATALTT